MKMVCLCAIVLFAKNVISMSGCNSCSSLYILVGTEIARELLFLLLFCIFIRVVCCCSMRL